MGITGTILTRPAPELDDPRREDAEIDAEALDDDTVSFTAILRVIDEMYDLTRDRGQLRRAGLAALAFATEEDLELLDYVAEIYTTRRPRVAANGLWASAKSDTPRGRHLAALLPPEQPGFAPGDPHRFSNPHLFGTAVPAEATPAGTDAEDAVVADCRDLDEASAPAGSPWDLEVALPRIKGEQQRGRLNWMMERIVDHLTTHPYPRACEEIATLRKLCGPEDLVYFDACVPTSDPQLYEPADPDLNNPDTIARGLDAADWGVKPVRDRYRPQKLPKTRPTAVTGTPRADSHADQRRRVTAHRAKGAGRRRAAAAEATVAAYFDTRGFLDHAAESEPFDYLDLRARVYHREADQEAVDQRKAAAREARRQARRDARRGREVDAEDARRRWDRVYVDFVSGQLHETSTYLGDPVKCEDYSHRVAENRTKIRISADEREPFQQNGNNLDYDHASVERLVGWPCVSCFIERPDEMNRAAYHYIDGRWRSDDGLCESCRMDGRPGLPELPRGFTNRELLEARATFLVRTYGASADIVLDRVARALSWRHPARPLIRAFISPGFGQPVSSPVDLDAPTPAPRRRAAHGPAVGRGQRRGRCRCCFEDKAVHADDRCTGCRLYLGIITAPKSKRTVAV